MLPIGRDGTMGLICAESVVAAVSFFAAGFRTGGRLC
jgi:hypothetical protein